MRVKIVNGLNRQFFFQISVFDTPRYISLSSFYYKKFRQKKRFLQDKVIKEKRFYE